jgi:hypothetical protein
MGLGEELLGDPRRGGDGRAIGFDWAKVGDPMVIL